ncbi:MAG: hypothetical protein QGH94_06660 [Phycisphaerae bacterium]|nr:hypothetical protein [Phycisphaerae bacterium]
MMNKARYAFLSLMAFLVLAASAVGVRAEPAKSTKPAKPSQSVKPPFGGTIFVNRNIITNEDPSAFKCVVPAGRAEVGMFDRRPKQPHKVNAYLFTATFTDGQTMEIRVNPEFGAEGALAQAKIYLPYIGQMPYTVRRDIKRVLIHKGKKGFGGGGAGILIHTDMGESYMKSGILTETLIHEASHTSLDHRHSGAKGWLEAQEKDGAFISGYSKSHPRREDVAETYLMYFAVRYKPDRIDQKLKDTITKTVPNRIKYFDSLNLNMYPVAGPKAPGSAIAAVQTEALRKELKLNAEQTAKFKTLGQELDEEIKKLKKQKADTRAIKTQFDKKALALLTAAQIKSLETTKSTPPPPRAKQEPKKK